MSAPQRFRKKPVVIEAMRFAGGADSATPIIDWILGGGHTATWHEAYGAHTFDDGKGYPASPEGINITTLEGVMTASPGDWIIRGIRGEFYPCKPDIFEDTYEEAQR